LGKGREEVKLDNEPIIEFGGFKLHYCGKGQ